MRVTQAYQRYPKWVGLAHIHRADNSKYLLTGNTDYIVGFEDWQFEAYQLTSGSESSFTQHKVWLRPTRDDIITLRKKTYANKVPKLAHPGAKRGKPGVGKRNWLRQLQKAERLGDIEKKRQRKLASAEGYQVTPSDSKVARLKK